MQTTLEFRLKSRHGVFFKGLTGSYKLSYIILMANI